MNPLNKNEEELKRQLDGQQFPFDEAQWEAARELLDRELPVNQKKKRGAWVYYTLPSVVMLLFAGIWFLSQEKEILIYNPTPKELPAQAEQKNDAKVNTKQPTTTHGKETNANSRGDGAQNGNNTNSKQALSMGKPTPHLKNDRSIKSNNESEQNNPNIVLGEEDTELPVRNKLTIPATIDAKIELPKTDQIQVQLTALPESMVSLPNPNAKDKDKPEKYPQNYITPFFALNNSRVINPDTANYYGRNLSFGILFNRKITKKIGYITGITYSRVLSSALQKTYTTEEYSFGVQKTSTVIGTNTLHYIELPILFQYSLAKKFSLSAGFTGSYLLNTDNSVTQYSHTNHGQTVVSSQKATSYRRGIQSYDLQWQLGIETALLKNNSLHVGLLAGYGLFDITLNNYYKNTVVDRNGRLQLYIRYDIFKF